MNKLCALFVLASASYALAAVERYIPEPKPEKFAYKEGCYLEETGEVYPYDTPVNTEDGSCSQFLCSKSNNETQKFTCGAVDIKDGCKKVVDLARPYPECCPKEQCDATPAAPTTTAPSTTPSPAAAAAAPGPSYASAFAKSEPEQPPVTQTYATPGASAAAAAS